VGTGLPGIGTAAATLAPFTLVNAGVISTSALLLTGDVA
jgi:hypothetical protein